VKGASADSDHDDSDDDKEDNAGAVPNGDGILTALFLLSPLMHS
jgi:hypothetical protein